MGILILFAGAMVALIVWAVRVIADHQAESTARRARAQADHQRRRAAFLAAASPIEAQAFLVQEQTNALIEAQQRQTATIGLLMLINHQQGQFGHGR